MSGSRNAFDNWDGLGSTFLQRLKIVVFIPTATQLFKTTETSKKLRWATKVGVANIHRYKRTLESSPTLQSPL